MGLVVVVLALTGCSSSSTTPSVAPRSHSPIVDAKIGLRITPPPGFVQGTSPTGFFSLSLKKEQSGKAVAAIELGSIDEKHVPAGSPRKVALGFFTYFGSLLQRPRQIETNSGLLAGHAAIAVDGRVRTDDGPYLMRYLECRCGVGDTRIFALAVGVDSQTLATATQAIAAAQANR